MAKLTEQARHKLSKGVFGLPESRKYPMENKSHAAVAKSRASEEEHKGVISPSTEAKIDAKANKLLGKVGHKPKPDYFHNRKGGVGKSALTKTSTNV